MSIDEYLAQLDSVRRVAGKNVLGMIQDPVNSLNQGMSRLIENYIPTRTEMDDARSVMPGMSERFSGKINSLAGNAAMPLGTVLRMNGARMGWPNLESRLLYDGNPIDRMRMSPTESAIANMYLNRLGAGLHPDKAAAETAMWGAFHPQIGHEAVSDVMRRFSVAPSADVVPIRGR